MPIGVYARTKCVVKARLRAGLAADRVDDFSGWLRQRRYTDKSCCMVVDGDRHVREHGLYDLERVRQLQQPALT